MDEKSNVGDVTKTPDVKADANNIKDYDEPT